MKLDLDEIERVTRRARDAEIVLDASPTHVANRHHFAETFWDYGQATRMPVVLALIDRIRALENAVERAANLLEVNSDEGARKAWAAALRDELKAGAVVS